jgi:DNA-binding GntR family transcriptional regulator
MRDYFADIEDVKGVIESHEMTLAAIRTRDPAAIREAVDVHSPRSSVVADAGEGARTG